MPSSELSKMTYFSLESIKGIFMIPDCVTNLKDLIAHYREVLNGLEALEEDGWVFNVNDCAFFELYHTDRQKAVDYLGEDHVAQLEKEFLEDEDLEESEK